MEQFITKEQLSEYLILPKNFDWELVDQEIGFAEIFDIIPKQIYNSITDEKIKKLLTKAGVYYSFILSIPKLKVHIQNFGIQQFDNDKLKVAPWWDVRDLGLSMLKVADKCFSDAITLISKDEALKAQIPFFSEVSEHISTPEEFEKIYSINYSPKVFLKLQKFIKKAMILLVEEKLKKDCIIIIKSNNDLYQFLKDALAFYSLYYASLLPEFIFTQNSVVLQYDELPWQKSIVLDAHAKTLSGQNFCQLGNESIKVITDYIKKNINDFPCYSPPEPNRKMEARDSGIYL